MIETFNPLQIRSIIATLSFFSFTAATVLSFIVRIFIRISALPENRYSHF